jgi:hypothetical protein
MTPPPLNDTTGRVSGSGELSAQIAEVLATRFFAMVDATGLESGNVFTVGVLQQTIALIGQRVSAVTPPLHCTALEGRAKGA